MKISYAIHSSDSSSLYLDFWPIVSEIWKEKFNVTPILIYIDNDLDKIIDETYGKVIRLKPIENQPIHLQNQIVRFWFPIKYQNEVSIISDIDMLPISNEYFTKQIEKFDSKNYIHINPCVETYGRLPACYHIAKGEIFKEVLEIEEDWNKFYFKVLNEGSIICNNNNLPIWFCDESYTSTKVLGKTHTEIIKLISRENGQNGFRIDRSNWFYNKWLLNFDYYYDLHSLRPLKDYKNEINEIKNLIINSKKRKPYKIEFLIFDYLIRIINKIKNIF